MKGLAPHQPEDGLDPPQRRMVAEPQQDWARLVVQPMDQWAYLCLHGGRRLRHEPATLVGQPDVNEKNEMTVENGLVEMHNMKPVKQKKNLVNLSSAGLPASSLLRANLARFPFAVSQDSRICSDGEARPAHP